MCDFRPGDEVVCVYTGTVDPALRIPTNLVEGAVYTITAVGPTPARNHRRGEIVVWLAEVANVTPISGDIGYWPGRFRKVQKPKSDLSIESFLTIKPGFEEPRRVKERVKA